METSERLKTALRQTAEREVMQLVESLGEVERGDLKGVEEQIMGSVFALGRSLMEQVLSSEAEQERPPARREGECGHRQRLVAERPKQLLTLMGTVSFRRAYYQCLLKAGEQAAVGQAAGDGEEQACTHGEAPADALWGVEERRTTAGVQKVMGYLCASLTLEEAAATFSRILPLAMSARQALSLIQPVGERLGEREEEQVRLLWQQTAQEQVAEDPARSLEGVEAIARLYIEMDGINVRLRRGSVPMEEKEQQRSGDVYREVKVGAIFTAARGPRRSKLVPGVFVDEADEQSYVARRCAAEDFGKLLYAKASECGLGRAEQVVVLSDGAVWIRHLVAEHFPGALHIVDLWHAREHVWDVAHAVFGRSTPQGVSWATQGCNWLEQGQIETLVTAIQALPPIPPESGASRSVPEIEADYFTTNAQRMRYPAFRAQGVQVGSGIAEAACKTVVSTRAKRSGMRWTPAGLDGVLALRIAVLNGAYDAFWEDQHGLVA